MYPRPLPGEFVWSPRNRGREHPAFARPDDADDRLVDRGCYAQRLAEPRDRAVDGIHLASAAGIVVQQHRRPRVGNLAAEFADVLDRIADIQPDVGGLRHRDRFFRAGPRDAPGVGVCEDFANRQPCGAGRPGEGDVHDQLFPDHLPDVVEKGDLEAGQFRKAWRRPAEAASAARQMRRTGSSPCLVVMGMARRPYRSTETADHADRKPIGAEDRGRDFQAIPGRYWMVCTIVSGPSSGRQDFAAASTSKALVAMMTRSQGPIPSVVVEA